MEETIMKSFIEATRHIFQHRVGINIAQADSGTTLEPSVSLGVLSMLSFTGKFRGRYVMDLSPVLVKNVTNKLLPADAFPKTLSYLQISAISNLCNSIIENLHGFLEGDMLSNMHLAPPIILVGQSLVFDSEESIFQRYNTEFGELKIYFSYYDETMIH